MQQGRLLAAGLALLTLSCAVSVAEVAAAAPSGVYTSFREYQRALDGAHVAKTTGSEPGNVQGGYYYEGPSFKRTTAGLSVPSCDQSLGAVTFANLNLQCHAAEGYGRHSADVSIGLSMPTGTCMVSYVYEAFPWHDAQGNDVDPPLPAQIGSWTAECNLPEECTGDEQGYGSHKGKTRYRMEGSVYYAENIYAKNLDCFQNTNYVFREDIGLLYQCEVEAEARKKAAEDPTAVPDKKHAKKQQRKAARKGRRNNQPTDGAPAQAPSVHKDQPLQAGEKVAAQVAYIDDADNNATYYKLEWAYLLTGTVTTYDGHGDVKWRGHVQIVEDLLYTTDSGDPISVPASSVNGLVIDCSNVQFEWLDAHPQYSA